MGGDIRKQQQGMAGRGFGSNSVLAEALGATTRSKGNADMANAALTLRSGMAKDNATQQLNAETLRASAGNDWNNADIARRKALLDAQTAANSAYMGSMSALSRMG